MKKLKFQNSLEEYTITKSRSSITDHNNTTFSVMVMEGHVPECCAPLSCTTVTVSSRFVPLSV